MNGKVIVQSAPAFGDKAAKRWPEPVVKLYDGIHVVRDDLIPGGTKRRFVDSFMLTVSNNEVVYAATAYGGAQIALALAAAEAGKQATIFVAKRKKLYPRTQEAKDAGAKIIEVPMGFLSNVQAKARVYCEKTGAYLMPFGFDSVEARAAIAEAAKSVLKRYGRFDEVWCVVGSGTMIRALQEAQLGRAYFAVAVGRDNPEAGSAKVIRYPRPFSADAKVLPPFPSCSNYDAKVWEYIQERGQDKDKERILFWNVM
jgi:hypothetical protein